MNFRIIKDKAELDGTAYFEFLPGKYNGTCWNDNAIFLDEDSMALVEEIFERNVEHYDHFAFSEIDKGQGSRILADLQKLEIEITSNKKISGETFSDEYYNALNEQVANNKEKAVEVISGLRQWLDVTLEKNDCVSILGL